MADGQQFETVDPIELLFALRQMLEDHVEVGLSIPKASAVLVSDGDQQTFLDSLKTILRSALLKYGIEGSKGYNPYRCIHRVGTVTGIIDVESIPLPIGDMYDRETGRFVNSSYLPHIIPLQSPALIPENLLLLIEKDILAIGMANFGYSVKFSVTLPFALVSSTCSMLDSVIVIQGSFSSTADQATEGPRATSGQKQKDSVEKAKQIVCGDQVRERELFLSAMRTPARASKLSRPVITGSSIGGSKNDNEGSACVYVTSETHGIRLLTVARVVLSLPFPEDVTQPLQDARLPPEGAQVAYPRRLDAIKALHTLLCSDELDGLQQWVDVYERVCGRDYDVHLGVDQEGYRADWALLSIDQEYEGSNGVWWRTEIWESIRDEPGGGVEIDPNGALIGVVNQCLAKPKL